MPDTRTRGLFKEGKAAIGGWLSIASSFSAELMAHLGLDWLCIDMQHGVIGYDAAVPMLQAINLTDVTPIVRVPWNDPSDIMKALDAGAYGVIVPMVNDAEQAQRAVAACRYPPAGIRSYGPTRVSVHAGADYFRTANEQVLCIPQIETVEAMENLDAMLSVPGIDAVYIGPMDLSISLGVKAEMDGDVPEYAKARQAVLEACRRHGVVAGINSTPRTAAKRAAEGFGFVLATSDVRALVSGAMDDIRRARGQAQSGGEAAVAYQ